MTTLAWSATRSIASVHRTEIAMIVVDSISTQRLIGNARSVTRLLTITSTAPDSRAMKRVTPRSLARENGCSQSKINPYMKIEIEYQYDQENEPHFWAVSKLPDGNKEFSGGDSWEMARDRHIAKLRNKITPIPAIPETETIIL